MVVCCNVFRQLLKKAGASTYAFKTSDCPAVETINCLPEPLGSSSKPAHIERLAWKKLCAASTSMADTFNVRV